MHTVCGLSNVSFGLPARKLINQTFLVQAMQAGLDAAIVDPLDKRLMSLIYASELLLDRDEYAANFLAAFREERLEIYCITDERGFVMPRVIAQRILAPKISWFRVEAPEVAAKAEPGQFVVVRLDEEANGSP